MNEMSKKKNWLGSFPKNKQNHTGGKSWVCASSVEKPFALFHGNKHEVPQWRETFCKTRYANGFCA